jgi:ferredoxin
MFSRLAGCLTQRLWFGHKTRAYTGRVKIDAGRCIGCGKCARLCPTGNIAMNGKTAQAKERCTLCYRCVNLCPKQAVTLLGKRVIAQTGIEKYL